MKILATGLSVLAVSATGALAGGLDRTGQPIQPLFEPGGVEGGYLELGFARTFPAISGKGVGITASTPAGPFQLLPPGTRYNNVGGDFTTLQFALKYDFNDRWSGALFYDQPYGSDIVYPGSSEMTELGGTKALADTESFTALLRYKFTDRWSAYGGPRVQRISGDIALSGLAYGLPANVAPYVPLAAGGPQGTVNGYAVELEQDVAWGYVIGGAFEIPEIAARISLTYNSAIAHKLDAKESGPDVLVGVSATDPGNPASITPILAPALTGTDEIEVKSPQSVNLEFRTGIAVDTLLFGSIRWVDWSEFKIDPKRLWDYADSGLVDLDDTTTYALGIGRQFTDQWAASIAMSYEIAGDDMVSPLSPTDGLFAVILGVSYDLGDFSITGGLRHAWLGDADAETGTPDVQRAIFDDNTATSVGIRIGYNF